jgi:hypothetical protein
MTGYEVIAQTTEAIRRTCRLVLGATRLRLGLPKRQVRASRLPRVTAPTDDREASGDTKYESRPTYIQGDHTPDCCGRKGCSSTGRTPGLRTCCDGWVEVRWDRRPASPKTNQTGGTPVPPSSHRPGPTRQLDGDRPLPRSGAAGERPGGRLPLPALVRRVRGVASDRPRKAILRNWASAPNELPGSTDSP